MRPRRLVLVGTVLVDLVAALPALPPSGGDVVAEARWTGAGGGATVLRTAARLGLPSVFGGRHGAGPLGAAARAALAQAGVDVLLPQADPADGDTGWCVVLVDPSGERTMVSATGVEARLRPSDLAAVEHQLQPGDAVYVSGYDLAYPVSGPVLAPWSAALREDVLLVVDPGPLVAEVPPDRLAPVLARTDLLTMNAREADLLGDVDLPRPGAVVVRRDGPRAATVTAADGRVLARDVPPSTRPVDTTGAGDVHTGVLLAALATGDDWPAALRRADAEAAASVARPGTG